MKKGEPAASSPSTVGARHSRRGSGSPMSPRAPAASGPAVTQSSGANPLHFSLSWWFTRTIHSP